MELLCEDLGTTLIRIFLRCMIELCASMAGLGSFWVATPVERNAAMCSGLIFALPCFHYLGAAFFMMSIGGISEGQAWGHSG